MILLRSKSEKGSNVVHGFVQYVSSCYLRFAVVGSFYGEEEKAD